MTKIKLYSGTEIEQIEWASKTNGKAVQNYFTEMLLHQASYYIDNVTAQLMILEIDRLLLPITVSTPYKGNSYVVSPYTQYIDYAIEELRELKHPILETGLKGMLRLIGRFFYKSEIDRIVIVNNWLLSTNLYENLKEGQAKEITLFLAEKFPDCAIMFRSLTNTLHTDIISELGNIGCKFIPSRSIYLFYPHKFNIFSKRQKKAIRRDMKFLHQSGYEVVSHDRITESDLKMVWELYKRLYLQKYSYYNPQFNVRFLTNAWKHRLIEFKLLKKNNQVYGVVGFVVCNGMMTTPILGYDTSLSKEEGLYRLCSILLTDHSLENEILLHRSAGAGRFKRLRGAINEIEYSLVFCQHLSLKRKSVWSFLEKTLTKIGIPLLKKYEL